MLYINLVVLDMKDMLYINPAVNETSIISLFLAVLDSHLAQNFVGEIGISKLSCCYGNYVAMVTTVIL